MIRCKDVEAEPCYYCKRGTLDACITHTIHSYLSGDKEDIMFVFRFINRHPDITTYLQAVIKHKFPHLEKLLVLM